jgi:hypothetical protein
MLHCNTVTLPRLLTTALSTNLRHHPPPHPLQASQYTVSPDTPLTCTLVCTFNATQAPPSGQSSMGSVNVQWSAGNGVQQEAIVEPLTVDWSTAASSFAPAGCVGVSDTNSPVPSGQVCFPNGMTNTFTKKFSYTKTLSFLSTCPTAGVAGLGEFAQVKIRNATLSLETATNTQYQSNGVESPGPVDDAPVQLKGCCRVHQVIKPATKKCITRKCDKTAKLSSKTGLCKCLAGKFRTAESDAACNGVCLVGMTGAPDDLTCVCAKGLGFKTNNPADGCAKCPAGKTLDIATSQCV